MATTSSFTSYKSDIFGASGGQLAVSKDPWGEFFGEPRFTGNQSPYDVERRDTWILPEAYKGVSKMLGDTVEHQVWSDQNFYTQVMPIVFVEGANYVQWHHTEYSQQMPTLVPELGVSRIMTSNVSSKSATFDRRGIKFYMEHGFMHTPAGRRHYNETLTQLALNVLE